MSRRLAGGRFLDIGITGDKRLQKKFNKLQSRVRSRIMRDAAKKAMIPVQQLAFQRAPKGATKKLSRFIKVATFRGKYAVGAVVQTGTRKQVGVESNAKFYYPAAIEYGFTARDGRQIPPNPFLRSSMADRRNQAIKTLAREIKKMMRRL